MEINLSSRSHMTKHYPKECATAKMNYMELRPKASMVEAESGPQKLQVSKEWMLPPKTKPGRRPKLVTKREQEEMSTGEACEVIKKKKNREAQRAYRERRASQFQELQDLVDKWKKRCQELKLELKKSEERANQFEQQNAELTAKLKKYETVDKTSKCGMCVKDMCICEEMGFNSSSTSLLDPALQQRIDNFKPMDAVSLKPKPKKRKLATTGLPVFKRVEQLPVSLEPSPGVVNEALRYQVGSQGCGFCSDSSTCVCKELDTQVLAGSSAREQPNNADSCNTQPGSCEQCQRDPHRKQFCQSVNEIGSLKSDYYSGELIPINDAYQRIRKHMENNAMLKDNHLLNSEAPTPSHFSIVSQLNIRGGQVELKSVIDVLRQMDRNLFT